jgi:hypothetical protein
MEGFELTTGALQRETEPGKAASEHGTFVMVTALVVQR